MLAGYQLEAQVGAGGMAVVFRARDQRLDRLVALKILASAQAADRELRHRFIAESRAAAAVDDPHIIPVYEAGEADGVLFIAMRFIQGGDLWQVLERERPLPPARTAAFISPVASALDAAHRARLVHRDVKPGNILVDARPDRPDHVYLSDFGISKRAVSSMGPTAAGQWVGTVDYAAPEQIKGQAVDGRADQYALACVVGPPGAATVPPAAVNTTGSAHREAKKRLPGVYAAANVAGQLTGKPEMAAEPGRLTAEPARSKANSYWSSDVENALAANPERATLSRAGPSHRAQPRRSSRSSGSGGHRRGRIVAAILLALVAVVVVGGYLAVQSTQGQYYLTATNGQIVIYQGVNQQILWYKLYHVYEQTGILLSKVPTNDQQTVSSYPPGNLAHAKSSVANIRAAVNLCQRQYTALRDWVTSDNRYLAEVAQAHKNKKPTTHIVKPNPPTAPTVGPFCQPSQVFGIPASDLTPTPAGSSS